MRVGLYLGRELASLSLPLTAKPPRMTIDELVAQARDLEARGFDSVWLANVFEFDAVTAMSLVGRETPRIEVATGVVPTFPRHPAVLAQQALTAQAAARGRFTLGIGLSHPLIVQDMLGLEYDRPARHMEEYLEVLLPLLSAKQASYKGERYRVNVGVSVPGASHVPVLLAALAPRMLDLAGRCVDGTVTWMAGPRTLETHVGPLIRAAAEGAGKPAPRMVGGFPMAVTNDAARARGVAAEVFSLYGALPAHRAVLDLEGVAGPADVALVGDETALLADLRRLEDIGVTDLAIQPFEPDPGATRRTVEFLTALLEKPGATRG
jgi:F420-dependent oxidoreductase-like protein